MLPNYISLLGDELIAAEARLVSVAPGRSPWEPL